MSIGAAVKEVLDEWGIKCWTEREAALADGEEKPMVGVISYDTTATNTSKEVGRIIDL